MSHGLRFVVVLCGVLSTVLPVSAADLPQSGDYEALLRRVQALENRTRRLAGSQDDGLSRATGHSVRQTGAYADVPPAPAATESLVGRMSNLEESWAAFLHDREKPKAKPGHPTLHIHGRIHLDGWSFTHSSDGIGYFENPMTGVDPEDRLFFRRLRLKFDGDIFEDMLYRFQIDFNTPQTGELKDAYIGFKNLPFFQRILIGNQKRPIGLDHLNSSRFNIFMERPLVVEAFNEDARRLGIAAYGVSEDEVFNWRYGAFAMENLVKDGKIVGDSRQWSLNGRLASSPWYEDGGRNYFHWAVAAMFAHPDGDVDPNDTNANEGRFRTRGEDRSSNRWLDTGRIAGADWYETLGLESILNVGPLQVVGEYQFNWMQRDNTTPGTGPNLFFNGAYIFAAYMLTGEHMPYNRKSGTIGRIKPFRNFSPLHHNFDDDASGWGAWQVAVRYSYLDLTSRDIRGGVENDVSAAVVWYFNDHASMQFNAVYGDIEDRAAVSGFTGGTFTALGTRLRIDF